MANQVLDKGHIDSCGCGLFSMNLSSREEDKEDNTTEAWFVPVSTSFAVSPCASCRASPIRDPPSSDYNNAGNTLVNQHKACAPPLKLISKPFNIIQYNLGSIPNKSERHPKSSPSPAKQDTAHDIDKVRVQCEVDEPSKWNKQAFIQDAVDGGEACATVMQRIGQAILA